MVLPLPSGVASGDSAELAATEAAAVSCVVSPCVCSLLKRDAGSFA